MANMKFNKKPKKKELTCMSESDTPEYPWGLSIRLEKEQLEKLSFNPGSVGDKVIFVATAEVTSISKQDYKEGSEYDVSLQIQDMEVKQDSENNTADTLYSQE